jgi:hypothetical protein
MKSALPTELVENIAEFMDIHSIARYRLTCKAHDTQLLRHFGRTYFSDINFLPSRFGLQGLVEISKSRLAQYVTTVGFGPWRSGVGDVLPMESANHSDAVFEQIATDVAAFADDNRNMHILAEDAAMITDAFSNLSAVTTLRFLQLSSGSSEQHPSYGEAQFKAIKGPHYRSVVDYFEESRARSRIFSIAINAAMTASLAIKVIDTCFNDWIDDIGWLYLEDQCEVFGYDCLVEFPPAARASGAGHNFATLSTLRFAIGPSYRLVHKVRRRQFLRRVADFLYTLPQLETLGISLTRTPWDSDTAKDLSATGALGSLRTLELYNISICSHRLIEVLLPLRSNLKRLKLRCVAFDTNAHADFLNLLTWLAGNMPLMRECEVEIPILDMVEMDDEELQMRVKATSHLEFAELMQKKVAEWEGYFREYDLLL